jgi:hypothetical protein
VTGRKTSWVFMNDCYMKVDGEVLLKEEYKAVIAAREGLKHRAL